MRYTNRLNLPQPIVDAVQRKSYDGPFDDKTFSVTQLLQPARLNELMRRNDAKIVEDVADRIWALMGTSVHEVLEKSDSSALKEERLWAPIPDTPGLKLTGRFDRLALIRDPYDRMILQDYKLASVWEVIMEAKPDRARQLNMLRWLCVKNGYKVDGLQNIMILRDWSLRKSKTEEGYPDHQVAIIEQPMWAMAEAENFIHERAMQLLAARAAESQDDLPRCSPEETWERPTQYAVMKKDRQRALRVFGSADEAQAWIDVYDYPNQVSIEVRRGEKVRCESYCPVADFCEQFHE